LYVAQADVKKILKGIEFRYTWYHDTRLAAKATDLQGSIRMYHFVPMDMLADALYDCKKRQNDSREIADVLHRLIEENQ
jgi:hypothetical protein